MPKLSKKRLPVLLADGLRQIVKACNTRDKALVLFMADSGLRRAEVCALNWSDVGMHITPHALRRTFVILSLRSGMDVLHLQAMLGHASLEMVTHYAQMQDEDLLQAHN
jgi:hypothetical protein